LYILGVHEIVGLEEIIDMSTKRKMSAVCASTDAECYFIQAEQLVDCINMFKISENMLKE